MAAVERSTESLDLPADDRAAPDESVRQLRSAEVHLAEWQDGLARAQAEKLTLWSRVAEVRAASLTAGQLRGPPTRSDRRMRSLVERRAGRRAEIVERLDNKDSAAQERDGELSMLRQQAVSAADEYEQAQAQLDAALQADTRYPTLAERRAHAQETLTGLSERLTYAVQECDRKSAQYLADPLFAYLRRRGYGAREYQKKGLAYRLDRWVAAVSHYDRALQDYELLQDMPRWLQENIDATAPLAAQAEAELADYLNARPDVARVRELESTAAQAQETLAAREQAIAAAIQEEAGMDGELIAIDEHEDRDSLEIRDLYLKAFGGQPIQALAKLAEQTDSPLDEEAVRQIDRLNHHEEALAARIEQLEEDIETRRAIIGDDRGRAAVSRF